MTVVAATFGALSEVQMMHAIYHFKAQEVNNPMLQIVCNSELKRGSYSHYKPITLSWRKHFAKCCEITLLLRSDFAAFLNNVMFLLLTMPDLCREKEAGNLKSHLRSPVKIAWCCEIILQPSWVSAKSRRHHFSPAKWILKPPDICYRHWEIFSIRFLLSKSQNTPCKPPITWFLSF